MKDRLKEIRNNHPKGKNQEMFADFLGIPFSNLASYETGRRKPTDAVIQLICEKCRVNEEWLRNGVGRRERPINKNEQIADMISDVLESDDESFERRLISALARLDDDGWKRLEDFIDSISANK